MMIPSHPLATELVARTKARGFNLVGFVSAPAFDADQPRERQAVTFDAGCGSIFLLGNGGDGLWRMMRKVGAIEPEVQPRPDYHPTNTYTAVVVADQVAWLADHEVHGRATFPDDSPSLDFLRLAGLAGWGTVSPVIGLLLHEKFGPWVGLRAAILLRGEPFGAIEPPLRAAKFEPCSGCDQPCVRACPVGVFDGRGGIDLETCANHRHPGNCATGCDARRACPVGSEHRYGADEERFRHAYSLYTMRRHFGLHA